MLLYNSKYAGSLSIDNQKYFRQHKNWFLFIPFYMNIALVGASGRLGSEVKKILEKKHVVIAVDITERDFISLDELTLLPELIIDTSTASQSVQSGRFAYLNNIPIVIACTGHDSHQIGEIKTYSIAIPIFLAYNMAFGVQIFKETTEFIAERFEADIHIHETHHKNKLDAPSGTAKEVEDILSDLGKPFSTTSARGGTVVGEHQISFYGNGETITLTHTAQSRETFASGIAKAAEFIVSQPSGFYNMKDLTSSHSLSI